MYLTFKAFTIFLIIISTTFTVKSVKANATTRHTVYFTVNSNLTTSVKHTINLNYNDKYSGIEKITIDEPTTQISDLSKPLSKNGYTVENENSKVTLKFNELVVGPANLNLEYSYNSNEILKKIGTLYSMELPKVTGSEIESFELYVYLPEFIPISEYKNNFKNDAEGKYLLFTKEDVEKYGQYINFGKEIYYELSVKHLISSEKNYIVIPPTINNRQEVFIDNISDSPQKIYKDVDNNLIFEYEKNSNTKSINATYLIRIYGNEYKDNITDYKHLLQPIKNWDFKKGLPLDITKKIIDSNNAIERAFVLTTNTLEYNKNSISLVSNSRIGAENITSSNSKNAVCLEYSDLLISILRGIGVPAREVNGLAYKNNILFYKDPELHSWVEYFDGKVWKQVDPTFADTSNDDYFNNFDLYHIAFLRRSENSEYPLLTGSFSSNNIREQLKIKTTNKPVPKKVVLKYINLYFTYFVLNESYSYILNIAPKSAGFVNKSEFINIRNYTNSFIKVEIENAKLKDVLETQKTSIFLFFASSLLSFILFMFFHKRLITKKMQKKDKVSRIV